MLLSLLGGKATLRDAFGDAKDCENDRANAEHAVQFHLGIAHTVHANRALLTKGAFGTVTLY